MDLLSIRWAGLELHPGDVGDLLAIVEGLDGWEDSPPAEGHDSELALADGAQYGPKTLGPRVVAVAGAVAGPPARLALFRDALAGRTAARTPAEFTVTDRRAGRALTALVRAGTERLKIHHLGSAGFRYEVALTAADPRLYEAEWRTAVLSSAAGADTGRFYPRRYPWAYASAVLPNSAYLANPGNAEAPVLARYDGQLATTRLSGPGAASIAVAEIPAGMQLFVFTETLDAQTGQGQSRARFVLPGSRPLTVPPGGARWTLYGSGAGSVTLSWRGAWA